MTKSQNQGDGRVEGKISRDSASLVLVVTIADTTWRMFVPSVGLTLLGVWLDGAFSTKPWLMFTGVVVGALLAGLLVQRQIAATRRKNR